MGCVYVICCEKTQRRNVGQTTQEPEPHRRLARHIRDAARGSPYPFHAAIREHGAGCFFVEKVYKTDSEYLLNKVEGLWADIYNAYIWSTETDVDFPAGYNSALAGFSNKFRGRKHTTASKLKMSEARKRYLHSSSVSSSSDVSDVSDGSYELSSERSVPQTSHS
jgi:hypothetical protein